MTTVLDLSVTLTAPPANADPKVLASIALRCDMLGLSHSGDLLTDPLSEQERQDLRWYLEEYWQWPYEQFLTRGQQVEALLPEIGKRLYNALFDSREADRIVQKWLGLPEGQGDFQISIISELATVLSLPWELLHSETGYLALRARRPISIVRRLPQSELTSAMTTSFTPPLRILLVTTRPEGTGFVDPRGIARELLDEVQPAVDDGTITVEFLRPPTLSALQERLRDPNRPAVHILHFDGHGVFDPTTFSERTSPHLLQDGKRGMGMLAFETEDGKLHRVKAEDLAQTLQDSGVQLAMLTACQSAVSASDDALSSVAARLIRGGIKAVCAMSASVLVVSAVRYTEAFYKELAGGAEASLAQERARQALYINPLRHTVSRDLSEEGAPVELRDWWLPHFYQQQPLLLRPTTNKKRANRKSVDQESKPIFNSEMPATPRYGFTGRSRELLQLERWLRQGKLVVVHGFGGMGKTTLVREAADWLTRTGMYQRACFVSFEGGRGNANSLLSQLGFLLGVYDGNYTPDDPKKALALVRTALKQQRALVIADNLESILPGGEAPLEAEEHTLLWDVLLELRWMGAGVLLTSRTTSFGDGRLAEGAGVVHLRLAGLWPEDAYQLASSLLESLRIDRRRAPYELLREVLRQLDYHPLAIQLVLPSLRSLSLVQIKQDFAALLSHFMDETESGRNRSLVASLEYSMRRLSNAQRTLLPRLVVFEGGAMEDNLLAITEISEATWAELRPALEQAALLTVEHLDGVGPPFLHFHPVLVPYLRDQAEANDEALLARYAERYYKISGFYYQHYDRYPMQTRAIVQRELPNLRRALAVLLEAGQLESAVDMAGPIGRFLTIFGLHREQALVQQRLTHALAAQQMQTGNTLTQTEYLYESNLGEEEYRKGYLQAAISRFSRLLARIEAQPKGVPHGPDSFEHATTLGWLARCFEAGRNLSIAEQLYQRALAIAEMLVKQKAEDRHSLELQAMLLASLGNTLSDQGLYTDAKASHEHALQIDEQLGNLRGPATSRGQLGYIALAQGDYAEAQQRYQEALTTFQRLGEPAMEAIVWHNLGLVAQEQQNWAEAERCYRESLVLKEQLGDLAGVARTCSHLGQIAAKTDRFEEAKGWYQSTLVLSGQTDITGGDHAKHLSNLANLLVYEVEVGHAQNASVQLVEAQRYIEQAMVIDERLNNTDRWKRYSLLARIANQQGRAEVAKDYRRREREAYAAFAGNRFQINQQFGLHLPAFTAAQDNLEVRVQVEEILPQLEKNGWHISEALHRIWAGERDWHALVEGLDNGPALLILRVLETLDAPTDEAALSQQEVQGPETSQETTEK
jgi:tetratricopeptide (TPR) repeat protein